MRKLKEEQAIVESILSWLVDEKKPVIKKSWGNKEVKLSRPPPYLPKHTPFHYMMTKSITLDH